MTDAKPALPATSTEQKGLRRCANCGEHFKPWQSGQRFCGNNPECEKEEAAMEREAHEERRESAEQDDYGRY